MCGVRVSRWRCPSGSVLCLCLLLTALRGGDARAENTRRVSNVAAFAIVHNPPAPIQWGSRSFITPLLETYEEHEIFEPQKRRSGPPEIDVAAIRQRLRQALAQRAAVDLFILAHGNDYYRLLDAIEPALRQRLRLVYNSGCDDARDAREWQRRGVRAYIGHPDYSLSPIFLNRFRTLWWSGETASAAVAQANAHLHRVFVQRHAFDLLEAYYLIATRGRGEPSYRHTHATLFGDADVSIVTDASPPRHSAVLRPE